MSGLIIDPYRFAAGGGGGGAITLVESFSYSCSSTPGSYTFSATLEEDDFILLGGCADQFSSGSKVISGYTQLTQIADNQPSYSVNYKKVGSTPDTAIAHLDFGNSSQRTAWVGAVYRGVNTSTPFDVTFSNKKSAGTAASWNNLTTVTDNCALVAMGFLDDINTSTHTYDTTYVDGRQAVGTFSSSSMQQVLIAGGASGVKVGPTSTWGGNDNWHCLHMALRPA